jgi:hypothetical protein
MLIPLSGGLWQMIMILTDDGDYNGDSDDDDDHQNGSLDTV